MKKRILSFLALVLVLTLLALPAAARTGYVQDFAGLLTSEEAAELEQQCAAFRAERDLDVVILTTPQLMGTSAMNFADDFYDNNRYHENGVLFLVDMGSRQWHISTSGTAIDGLSDKDLAAMEDAVIPFLSKGAYYEGFSRFLAVLPGYLDNGRDSGINFFTSLVVGAAVAAVVLFVMRSLMNTKKPQHSAANYVCGDSFRLKTHQDLFLYSNITKRPRPQNNGSGSSTHRSSSGRSHGGRGGSF